MSVVQIRPSVYWIGVNDRTTDLFEGIWPITQEGVSYNSYFIDDHKKVLIDLAKSFKTDEFFEHVKEVVPISKLDYVVMNHIEPDHSGVIRILRQMNPKVVILSSAKLKNMLEAFYGITEDVNTVEDGESLDIGNRKIQFFSTPFVHWPETIMTYDNKEHILFSCDGFGGYGALRGAIFDDDCKDIDFYEKESLRYYVNIVALFSRPTLKAIEKLAGLNIEIIAPSHGHIWRKNPLRIVELYKKWAGYAQGEAEPGVTLLYGSMYGNTERMMNAVAQGISFKDIPIEIFDTARTHVSYILPSLWQYNGVVVGAPTYEGALFPPMVDTLNYAALKRIVNKKLITFGSYGWGGGALKTIKKIVEPLGWELIESYEFNGGPTDEDLKKGEEFGKKFAEMIVSKK
ncbi:MAG: FprA family A-type flavoprotein [Spirochaetota bacterium]|nr:MAG: FprA family A-type flavoprotein [Spirochaetota bacterium]